MRRLELLVWAFLLSLSFYPGPFGFLAWLSLVRPFMIFVSLDRRDAFRAAYFFAFFFNLFSIYWVAMVSTPGMIAAVVILGFYYSGALMIVHSAYRWRPLFGKILFPIVWVAIEYFRTLSEFAFPWSDLGYSQSYYGWILQSVSVISVHGLSLCIVAANVLLWQLFDKTISPPKRLTALLSSLGIVAVLLAHGYVVTPPYPEEGDYKIALLQGSVPLDVKWEKGKELASLGVYDSLATAAASDSNVQVMIWPETSAPCYFTHNWECRQQVAQIARKTMTPQLVGAMSLFREEGKYRYYNSCYQFDSNGEVETRHDKVWLVPFAEHVPYQDHFPFLAQDALRKYLTIIDEWEIEWWSDYYPGDSATIFDLGDAQYGVLICFETAFPEYVRGLIRSGAHFVVGITNDTWFGRSVGIHMHSRMFITRAVENRCWFARSANTGLSYFVDPYGRVRADLPLYEAAALVGSVNLLDKYSPFTEYGDVAGRWSLLLALLALVILLTRWLFTKLSSRQSS
jgi:apolipoprotein N-acyltransferase